MADARGEDRSAHQRVGPWTGLDFGIVKATEGLTFKDPAFPENWHNLKAEGKLRGAYHFLHPDLDPVKQSDFFWDYVEEHGLEPEDFAVCDSEIWLGLAADGAMLVSRGALRRSHLILAQNASDMLVVNPDGSVTARSSAMGSGRTADSSTSQFMLRSGLRQPRHQGMVYTDEAVGRSLVSCGRWALWLAHPGLVRPPAIGPWAEWLLWQWGQTGGFDGSDRDIARVSAAELRAWTLDGHKTPVLPEEDSMGQLNPGNGAQTEIVFPAGSAASITFGNDAAEIKADPAALWMRVHSLSGGWLPGESFQLPHSEPHTVRFGIADADAVSIQRRREGHDVVVGYCLNKP